MLIPAKAEAAGQLARYRAWDRAMLAAPSDRAARATFEDAGHTLCVLRGKPCAREAAKAAERCLRGGRDGCRRERGGGPRRRGGIRRAPPVKPRSRAARH
ncbi:DUF5133 domain-containing protein [Streptomyces sp. NPDC001508]|uniref:DUF5133 domain-containing protein n=1 Tax=Streptomyces sp. NPDC001508 TaxID=3154656 RepID=UPI00332CFBBA